VDVLYVNYVCTGTGSKRWIERKGVHPVVSAAVVTPLMEWRDVDTGTGAGVKLKGRGKGML